MSDLKKSYVKFTQKSDVKLDDINPLATNVPHHIETSQLICNAMMENIDR